MARRYPRVFGSAAARAQSRAAFSAAGGFLPIVDAALGGLIESNIVALTNVGSAVPLTISGGSYSKNGGAYSTAATTVSDGDTLRVRVTAPSTNSATATATVSVNSIARSFSVTTAAPSTGTPTLTLSQASPSIASSAAAGTLVSNISNVPAGVTPTVASDGGVLVRAGDATNGWKVVVGMSALSAGTVNFSVAATGATGASGVLTVTAAGSVVPFALNSDAAAYNTAATATGTPLSSGRQKSINRFYERLQQTTDNLGNAMVPLATVLKSVAWSRMNMIPSVGGVEGHWLIDMIRPSTNTLTKSGTPTFTAGVGVTTSAATSFYNTGVPLNTLPTTGVFMGMHTSRNPASPSSNGDCGAYDGTSGGLTLTARTTSGGASIRAQSVLTTATAGNTTWNGEGFTSLNLHADGSVELAHHGKTLETVTPAAVVPNGSTNPICILKASGASSASSASIMGFVLCPELTIGQQEILAAAIRELCSNCARWGDVDYFEPGVGPATVDADYLIYGATLAGIDAAHALAAAGKSVAICGTAFERRINHIGGEQANGLQYQDALIFDNTGISGRYRDFLTGCNTLFYGGSSDTNTQTDLSPESRAVNNMARRMLDPARTSAATGSGLLVGQDVKLYLSTGAKSFGLNGAGNPNSMTTVDGRTFTFRQFLNRDGEGGLFPLLPKIATVQGREAAGAGFESVSGFQPTQVAKPARSGTPINIDGYNTPGDATSGRISGFNALPNLTAGAAWYAGQQRSVRVKVTTEGFAQVPMARVNYGPAPTISADEFLGRWCAADSGLTFNLTIGGMRAIKNGFDWNSGTGFPIMEFPASGTKYFDAAAADGLTSTAARKAIMKQQEYWQLRVLQWCQSSTDPRRANAPSVRSQAIAYTLDAREHLDPAPGDQLHIPGMDYNRDPIVRPANTVIPPFSANDANATDGTAVRPGGRTATCSAYTSDNHAHDLIVGSDGFVKQLGNYYVAAGGTNGLTAIAVDHFMPDKAAYTNVSFTETPSCTQAGWTVARMQPQRMHASQFMTAMHMIAQETGVALQDVDYATAVTRAQSLGTTALYLPASV